MCPLSTPWLDCFFKDDLIGKLLSFKFLVGRHLPEDLRIENLLNEEIKLLLEERPLKT
jgi:hypothetical protein